MLSAARRRCRRRAVLSVAHRIGSTMPSPPQLDRCCRIHYQHVCSYPPILRKRGLIGRSKTKSILHGGSDLRFATECPGIANPCCHKRHGPPVHPPRPRRPHCLKRRQPDDRYWSPGCPVHAMSAKLTSRCCRDARRYEQPCRAANAGSTASHDAHGPCAPA